jgi:hypothetical protein
VGEVRDYLAERGAAAVRGLDRGTGAKALRKVSTHSFRQKAKIEATRFLAPVPRSSPRTAAAPRSAR